MSGHSSEGTARVVKSCMTSVRAWISYRVSDPCSGPAFVGGMRPTEDPR